MKLLHYVRLVPGPLALWAICALTPGTLFAAADPPTVTIEGQPPGSLSGKRVVLDPGHGLYFHDTYGWQFQRDPINGLHEDKHTNEIVMDWLRAHLEGAGARVFSTRAAHRQAVNVIVDNTDPGYAETGTWTTTTNVGLGYRGSYRYAGISRDAVTATATWSANLPARGDYPVWLWCYAGADRSQHASFTIHHAGGTTRVRVNQQLDRQRWVYLGTYTFVPTQPARGDTRQLRSECRGGNQRSGAGRRGAVRGRNGRLLAQWEAERLGALGRGVFLLHARPRRPGGGLQDQDDGAR